MQGFAQERSDSRDAGWQFCNAESLTTIFSPINRRSIHLSEGQFIPNEDDGLFSSSSSDQGMLLASHTEHGKPWRGPYEMSRVDWRWAAQRGFYDPKTKLWNAAAGGYEAYDRQRALLRSARKGGSKQQTGPGATCASSAYEGGGDVELVERPLPFRTCCVAFDRVSAAASPGLHISSRDEM